jgi:hypothetical protein
MHDKTNPDGNTMSILAALQLAKGYADLGHRGYLELNEAFERGFSDSDSLPTGVGMRAIAAAMVFSFAIEIYLKTLAFQCTGTYSGGHMLRDLADKLPFDVRKKIALKYQEQVKQKTNLLKLSYHFSMRETDESRSAPAAKNIKSSLDQWPGCTFDEAIELASPLFVKLRYLYEEVTDGFTADVDFRWLIFLLEAVRSQIHENAVDAVEEV